MTTINFEAVNCCHCGIVFQVPEQFDEDRQEDGQTFYCPNGHAQVYEDSENDQIKRLETENTELRRQVRQLKCRLIGKVGFKERVRVWWNGGLDKLT